MGCALCSLCNKCGNYTEVIKDMGTKTCPVCGAEAYEAAEACPQCGAALEISPEAIAVLHKHEDIKISRWKKLNLPKTVKTW